MSVFSILLPSPQPVSAQGSGNNLLANMGKSCNKMKKTGSEVSDADTLWYGCERIQDALKEKFGCDGGMFYSVDKATDPDDPSVTQTLWYTNAQKYSACVGKVQAQLNLIKSAECASMRHSSFDDSIDSPAWKKCEKSQNNLAALIGCDSGMFEEIPNKENLWRPIPAKLTSCQTKIDTAKNTKLTDSDGNETTAETAAPPPASAGGGSGSGSTDPATPDCDATKGVPLSWIICPVIDSGVNMTDYAFNKLIRPLLEDIPVSINPDDPSFKAWSSFRILGNVLLVGSLLMVVYSQARGPK